LSNLVSFARNAIRRGALAIVALAMFVIPNFGAAARSTWAIDPARTRISFSIDAVGYPKTSGRFSEFEGRIAIDFDHPAQSRVSFRVKAQSVDVGSERFNEYVRGEALLNAARFPEIGFVATSVEKIDEHSVRVAGELTMLGVTRPLVVVVDVQRRQGEARARLGFVASAKIDRLDFGMNSGFPIISREVDLVVASEAFEQ
jgi:polyisoprenoid-binding protein YceI